MNYELVKFVNNSLELEVNVSPKEETIWMDRDQIGLLFGRDRTVISRHIKNLFSDHELDKIKFVQKMHELVRMVNPILLITITST